VRPRLVLLLVVTSGLAQPAGAEGGIPPPGFTVAFIGDQGVTASAQAVLDLIAAEGADAVVHSGDFDYGDNPALWDQKITDTLSACYPYFASIGNHDVVPFYGPGGYQEHLAARLDCLGITWDGDLGVRSSHTWQGIFFVLTGPGIFADGDIEHAPYIRDQLALDDSI